MLKRRFRGAPRGVGGNPWHGGWRELDFSVCVHHGALWTGGGRGSGEIQDNIDLYFID